MEFQIPFSGRGHYYTDEEIAVVVEAMRSAGIIVTESPGELGLAVKSAIESFKP